MLPESEKSQLEYLTHKYASNLPRYTSYPTAAELKNSLDLTPIYDQLAKCSDAGEALSLYVHLPFCPSLCYFCACNKIITQDADLVQDYLRLLELEAKLLRSHLSQPLELAQIHWGGGSPSYLSLEQLSVVMEILQANFDCSKTLERSVEVDPRTMSHQKALRLYQLGFRRISLGVQDLDPEIQRLIHRVQPYSLVLDTLDYLREIGFEQINFDLIYGLPEQNPQGFERTIEAVIKMQPSRIALYGYAHVNWKEKVQNVFEKYHLPSGLERIGLFRMAENLLVQAGYVPVGLDHFCKPNDELALARAKGELRRNFMGYTVLKAKNVLGLGVSSISDLGSWLFQNHSELSAYQQALESKRLPLAKALQRTSDDQIRAGMIEAIMCNGQLKLAQLKLAPQAVEAARKIFSEAQNTLSAFAADGLIKLFEDELRVSALGRLFLRNIASAFDRYLPAHLAGSKPTFSKAL